MVQGVKIEKRCIINTNPANGDIISRTPVTSFSELTQRIHEAHEVQNVWSYDTTLSQRIELLRQGCTALKTVTTQLSLLITKEMGKPIRESEEEVNNIFQSDVFLSLLKQANEDIIYTHANTTSRIIRDPLGIVIILSPWNFPCDELMLMVLPALVAGNTVIVKPSEVAPLTGELTINTLKKWLPDGVLTVVQGDATVGKFLVEHKYVNMVALTGSCTVGREIKQSCAKIIPKRLILELGGNDPMIVFADADLKLAVKDSVKYSLFNAGQVCCSFERIYVEDSILEEFEQRVVEIVKGYKIGNGMDYNTDIGPLVSTVQRDKIHHMVQEACLQGAKIIYQTPSEDIPSVSSSSFYPITVMTHVNSHMKLQKLETFGPIICLSSFSGREEEAIQLANDTDYGLSSAVYSRDIEKAQRVALKIQAGQCGINCYSLEHCNRNCPWIGHKNSGYGFHSGMDGWRQFSLPKSLIIRNYETKENVNISEY